MITVNESSNSESKMDCSTMHQSSLMCEHSEDSDIVTNWISSLPVCPVSGYQSQENDTILQLLSISGLTPLESSERQDHYSPSLKTLLGLSLIRTSETFSRVWKKLVMSSQGRQRLLALMRWVPLTNENEPGFLLPTPSASSYGSNRGGAAGRVGKQRYSLETLAKRGELPGVTVLRKWPTICARDMNGAPGANFQRALLPREVGGSLNPEWIEWFMGWPIGATESKPLETVKFLLQLPSPLDFWWKTQQESLERLTEEIHV